MIMKMYVAYCRHVETNELFYLLEYNNDNDKYLSHIPRYIRNNTNKDMLDGDLFEIRKLLNDKGVRGNYTMGIGTIVVTLQEE